MATSTRTIIRRLHKRRPTITASEVADKAGISRQRVYSLASKMGIELAPAVRKPAKPTGACTICSKPLKYPGTTSHAKCHYVMARCKGCGVRFRMTRRDRARSKFVWHSRDCWKETA